jgi:hypothetical protein
MGDVIENRLRKHHVEAVAVEGEIEDVSLAECDVRHAEVAREGACPIELLRAEVDPDRLPVRCPLSQADSDRTGSATTVEDMTAGLHVLAKESAVPFRGARTHLRERTFFVPKGVAALGHHAVLLFGARQPLKLLIGQSITRRPGERRRGASWPPHERL